MAEIIRFPITLAPARRDRLALQHGVTPAAFDQLVRQRARAVEEAGCRGLDVQDLRFIEACKQGRIKPRDVGGSCPRAVIARRIIRDLNEQGARERNEPHSG